MAGEREIRIEGRRVYGGKAVSLDVDRVRLSDGTEALREAVRHPGAVVVVAIDAAGRVLLVRQFRYAPGETLLELPAGTLRPGELPEACARRELAEETGHAAERLEHLATFYSAPGFCDERLHCFLAVGLTPTSGAHPDEDERIEVVPMTLLEAEAMARGGALHDAKTIAGLLLVAGRTGRG
jgi:ADP-ribose diphosphatase